MMFNHLMSKARDADKPGLTTVMFKPRYWGRSDRKDKMTIFDDWFETGLQHRVNWNITCTTL
ncbi:hypothetical protein PG993_005222 [Apiospora rasikravindrae]|uniref:Transposase n=1 Tax=Apiospora rasikravindrae TaxID=990691 RepID=A0ABR1THP2_9PEZI